MNIANTIEVLKDLLRINNERVEDYEKASKDANATDLKPVLKGIADQSSKNVSELTGEIKKYGGEVDAAHAASVSKIVKAWAEFKSAFTGNDFESVLKSFEKGDASDLQGYKNAIASGDLSSEIRQLVRNQEAGLKTAGDQKKSYRDSHETD